MSEICKHLLIYAKTRDIWHQTLVCEVRKSYRYCNANTAIIPHRAAEPDAMGSPSTPTVPCEKIEPLFFLDYSANM